MSNMKYVAEFIGTVVFLTIVLKSSGDKYVVAAGLLAAILMMGSASGSYFNPAMSIASFFKGQLPTNELVGFLIAQVLGALVATKVAELYK